MKVRRSATPARYGTYAACDPAVIDDLKWMGFSMVSTANNHAVDYGEVGVLANIRNLKARAMPFAGTGGTLTEAAAPVYLDTPKGSVALIGVTLTMPPADHRAGEPRGPIKAGPARIRYATRSCTRCRPRSSTRCAKSDRD